MNIITIVRTGVYYLVIELINTMLHICVFFRFFILHLFSTHLEKYVYIKNKAGDLVKWSLIFAQGEFDKPSKLKGHRILLY